MPGQVYNIAAEPIDEAHTVWFPAEVLNLGLEHRRLTAETLKETMGHIPEVARAIERQSFEPSEGWTLHVCGSDDGHEYLRFDCFDNDPHYHYLHRTAADEPVVNHRIPYEDETGGAMWDWVMQCLRGRLPEMLTEARGGDLATRLDMVAVERAASAVDAKLQELA